MYTKFRPKVNRRGSRLRARFQNTRKTSPPKNTKDNIIKKAKMYRNFLRLCSVWSSLLLAFGPPAPALFGSKI